MELLPSCFGNMANLTKLAHLNNPWKMPQQEMLSWPDEFEQYAKRKLSLGMRVWARIQPTERMRYARIDAINEDGTFDLGFIDARGMNAEIRKERRMHLEVIPLSFSVVDIMVDLLIDDEDDGRGRERDGGGGGVGQVVVLGGRDGDDEDD
eukprot:768473-Hanusia_phi.AAC.14